MYRCKGKAFGSKLTETPENSQPNALPLPILDGTVQQLSDLLVMMHYLTAHALT